MQRGRNPWWISEYCFSRLIICVSVFDADEPATCLSRLRPAVESSTPPTDAYAILRPRVDYLYHIGAEIASVYFDNTLRRLTILPATVKIIRGRIRYAETLEVHMSIYVCPKCGGSLALAGGSYRCGSGHCYDVSREGYVNLLTADKKHSADPRR